MARLAAARIWNRSSTLPELNLVAILQVSALAVADRYIVDQSAVRRCTVVDEHITGMDAFDEGVLLFDFHVAEQSDVGVFVPAEQIRNLSSGYSRPSCQPRSTLTQAG